jgi:hypothetical protein
VKDARRKQALKDAPLEGFASDAFALFHDIEVVPGEAFRRQSVLVDGGPVWPDFDRQTLVRMVRRGRYIDEPVEPVDGPHEVITRPCLWGGYAIAHFGHLIADHLTRVLEGRVNRPHDLMLFLLRPGQGVDEVPGYFWDLMDWYGVPRGQVRFVTGPLRVAELRCYAQAEPFQSWPPSSRYLDLLAQNTVRMGLVADVAPVVYVGRMGMLAQAKSGAAGESYLVQVLQQVGVRVLDPGRAHLGEQLAAYAGAGVLIFAEGSAVHGRQLLGWQDQTIVILNRRQGARMAEAAMTPRCRELHFVEATGQGIGMGTMAAARQSALGLSLYDLTAVMAALARHGVDLTGLWDDAAYQAAVRADARTWLCAQRDVMGAARLDLTLATEALARVGVLVDV